MKRLILKLCLLSAFAFVYANADEAALVDGGTSCTGGGSTCTCSSGSTCTSNDTGCKCVRGL